MTLESGHSSRSSPYRDTESVTLQAGVSDLQDQVREHGYALLRRFNSAYLSRVVAEIGLPDNTSETSILVPRSLESSTPNTYSGIFGLNRFPFHSDRAHWRHPPRYLVLRCVTGFEAVRTPLIDSHRLLEVVGVDLLARTIVQPRRPVQGKMPLLFLYRRDDEASIFRWDEVFVRPVTDEGKTVFASLKSAIEKAEQIDVALVKSGDVLVVDNWRMLHGRSAVGPEHGGRLIERLYLENLNEAAD